MERVAVEESAVRGVVWLGVVGQSLLTEVQTHEEISKGKVSDQKPWHIHLGPGEYEHHHHRAIPQQRQQEHNPHPAAQRPPVEEVVAWHERPCGGVTLIHQND